MYLKPVVCPGAKLELADLVVERKVCDVNAARASQFHDGRPEHSAVSRNHSQGLHVARVVVIRARK